MRTESAVYVVGHGRTHFGRALCGCVAVQRYGVGMFNHIGESDIEFLGGRHGRVAQRKVKHVLFAYLPLAGVAVFKQFPYHRTDVAQLYISLVYHMPPP